MRLSGWSLGIRPSIENSANILACPSCVPRINASENTIGAILTYTVIFREKISQSGVFQQPASGLSLPPHALGGVHNHLELAPLLIFREQVTLHRGGESALGTEGEIFQGHILAGLVDAPLELVL